MKNVEEMTCDEILDYLRKKRNLITLNFDREDIESRISEHFFQNWKYESFISFLIEKILDEEFLLDVYNEFIFIQGD
jgi:hypothetical protein